MIDQKSADQEQEPLAHISEHDAEDEGVGDAHEYGRVHLIVGGQAVHLDKHFKWFEKLRILQFGRRFSEVGVVVVLNDNEYFVVVLDFFDEFLHVVFRHPSAENVIVFLIVFHPGRELAHVKVVGKLSRRSRAAMSWGARSESISPACLSRSWISRFTRAISRSRDWCAYAGVPSKSSLSSIRSKCRERNTASTFCASAGGNKISPVHETFIPLAFHEDRVQVTHEVFLHLVVEFHGDAANRYVM